MSKEGKKKKKKSKTKCTLMWINLSFQDRLKKLWTVKIIHFVHYTKLLASLWVPTILNTKPDMNLLLLYFLCQLIHEPYFFKLLFYKDKVKLDRFPSTQQSSTMLPVCFTLSCFLSLGCQRLKTLRADQQAARWDPVGPARLAYVTNMFAWNDQC